MKSLDIVRWRLYHQQIAAQKFKRADEVVGWLGAMQGQDFAGAKWGIGLRLPEATDVDIEEAIAKRTIVRTWPMRGTLHFVAAKDVRWMLSLLTPRIIAGSASRQRELELDVKVFSRCENLFVKALQGGRQLSRESIYALLEAKGIWTADQRGYHILWRLAQEGLICFGDREGKQQTFALLDEWVPAMKNLEREEALAELTRRYFMSHGPATLRDFVWWSGLKLTDARAGLESVASELVQEKVGEVVYWMSAEKSVLGRGSSAVYLLPGFDEYLLGYTNRSAALDPLHAGKVCPGGNGMFSPTIVIGGRVVGTWKRVIKKGAVVVEPKPFELFGEKEKRAIAKVAERYGRFLKISNDQ